MAPVLPGQLGYRSVRPIACLVAVTFACSTAEPGPSITLEQHLLGSWELVAIDGLPIPAWVPVGGWNDSVYVAWGRLDFETATGCSRAYGNANGAQPTVQRCNYEITGATTAVVVFADDPRRYGVTAVRTAANEWSSDLGLASFPCDPGTILCSHYREAYRKATP